MGNSATRTRWTTLMLLLALGIAVLALCIIPKQATAEGVTRELSAGDEFTNTITYGNEDLYTIESPKSGYVYFEVTVTDGDYNFLSFSDGVTVYGDISSDYTAYNGGITASIDSGTVRTGSISLPAGQTIDFTITAAYSAQVTYKVKAYVVTQQDFEAEPNDDQSQANTIPVNTPIRGIANANQRYEDSDFFTSVAETDGYITARARIIDNDSVDFSAYQEGEDAQEETANSGDGWVSLEKRYIKAGQSYYIDVTSKSSDNGALYEVELLFDSIKSEPKANKSDSIVTSPKAVSLKSVKAQSKSFVAKWSKGKNISGYQVRYSTSKSMAKAKYKVVSSAKVKLTVKKLKSKKRYYVQVRTYAKHSNPSKTYYSDWSNMKSVKVK